MRKAYKSIISLAVVLIAGLNMIVPAFAQDPFSAIAIGGIGGASGAGLFGSMAGMSGIDIAWSQSGADTMDSMWNVLNPDHVYFSGEKHEADPQTDPDDIWDYITVDIGDWLSAQSDFIVAFAQENNVTDNDSGNATTPKSYGSFPIDSNGYAYIGTAGFTGGTVNFGGIQITRTLSGTDTMFNYVTYLNGSTASYSDVLSRSNYGTAVPYYIYVSGENVKLVALKNNGTYQNCCSARNDHSHISNGSSVNWTSGDVNTSVFDGWEDAKVKIPHNISGLPSGWTVPDFTNALNNLWDQGLQGQIVIEDTDQPVPPPPIPDTPFSDLPFDNWVDLWGETVTDKQDETNEKLDYIGSNGHDQLEELENIDNNLDEILDHTENIDTNIGNITDDVSNIDTNVTDIADHVENIDTNVEDIEDIAESIDTNIGIGNGLLGGIRSLAQSAVDYLEGIAEHVGELVEEIVEGTETLIAGILNQIPSVFGVIFGPIKQASSIWHYVVEWIQSISTPMLWMWAMAGDTSYFIQLPIYASLAGAVVLAFYKRFGK